MGVGLWIDSICNTYRCCSTFFFHLAFWGNICCQLSHFYRLYSVFLFTLSVLHCLFRNFLYLYSLFSVIEGSSFVCMFCLFLLLSWIFVQPGQPLASLCFFPEPNRSCGSFILSLGFLPPSRPYCKWLLPYSCPELAYPQVESKMHTASPGPPK